MFHQKRMKLGCQDISSRSSDVKTYMIHCPGDQDRKAKQEPSCKPHDLFNFNFKSYERDRKKNGSTEFQCCKMKGKTDQTAITCMFHQTILIYSEVQRNLKKFETDVFHMNSTRGDWVMGLLTLPYNLVFVDQHSTDDPIWN